MEHPRRSHPIESVTLTLTRHEGNLEECDVPATFTTFRGAEACLNHWSHTAPEAGYHKTSVRVSIQSGPMDGTPCTTETHEAAFTFDLTRAGVRDLRLWLEQQTGFLTANWRPSRITPEEHKAFLIALLQNPTTREQRILCEALFARLRFLATNPLPETEPGMNSRVVFGVFAWNDKDEYVYAEARMTYRRRSSAEREAGRLTQDPTIPQPVGGWVVRPVEELTGLVDGESTKEERWETGRVRTTLAAWRATPRDYKTMNPRQILRQSLDGGTALYPVELV